MTEEWKKLTASTIRELYLYPYRSKGENTLRGGAWMASWLIGIAAQNTVDQQALGGAYIIFALSMLLEFVPERKSQPFSRLIHSLFCVLLFIMLLDSLLLSYETEPVQKASQHWSYHFLVYAPVKIGWIVFIMLFIGVVLVISEAHKYFYDEEAEREREAEIERKEIRDQFEANLYGANQGGNTQ